MSVGGREEGAALAEVVAAILVLELALVGVAGTVVVSGRALSDAARLERAAAAVGETVDSLALEPGSEEGLRPVPGGWIRWNPGEVDAAGLRPVRVVAVDSGGRRVLEVRAVVPGERSRQGPGGPAGGR